MPKVITDTTEDIVCRHGLELARLMNELRKAATGRKPNDHDATRTGGSDP